MAIAAAKISHVFVDQRRGEKVIEAPKIRQGCAGLEFQKLFSGCGFHRIETTVAAGKINRAICDRGRRVHRAAGFEAPFLFARARCNRVQAAIAAAEINVALHDRRRRAHRSRSFISPFDFLKLVHRVGRVHAAVLCIAAKHGSFVNAAFRALLASRHKQEHTRAANHQADLFAEHCISKYGRYSAIHLTANNVGPSSAAATISCRPRAVSCCPTIPTPSRKPCA